MEWWGILLIILAVVAAVLVVLYFLGKRNQRKQEAAQAQLDAMKQTVSILVIDKKKMRISQSGLPQVANDQIPKYLRWSKVYVVKAKIGHKVMNVLAEKAIFNELPIQKEVKVELKGIYISAIKGVRGGQVKLTKEQEKAKKKAERLENLKSKLNKKK
ncbi:MAG: hypothetical protein KBS79_01855 [Lachnospiraceae bacterium]|nr:hypothetical protein [Candidatus Minthocola equi]